MERGRRAAESFDLRPRDGGQRRRARPPVTGTIERLTTGGRGARAAAGRARFCCARAAAALRVARGVARARRPEGEESEVEEREERAVYCAAAPLGCVLYGRAPGLATGGARCRAPNAQGAPRGRQARPGTLWCRTACSSGRAAGRQVRGRGWEVAAPAASAVQAPRVSATQCLCSYSAVCACVCVACLWWRCARPDPDRPRRESEAEVRLRVARGGGTCGGYIVRTSRIG